MDHTAFASVSLLLSLVGPPPSRCPYCSADAEPHWIGWGKYERYAGDPENAALRVAVPRYRCRIVRRTFSLVPDNLLPYCSLRTALVLSLLYALYVREVGLNTLARTACIARGTLRWIKARFERVVSVLRLPVCDGAMSAAAFLKALEQTENATVVALFRGWKEGEPKHCIVGIYAR